MISRTFEPTTYSAELPLRMHRLAMVRGTVNGTHPANFVVDTGGEVISISDTTAGQIQPVTPYRRIPLKVYGTSGWDKDAFLMPGVDLAFNTIRFNHFPVVVLNLHAPSALLGFQLGGIVGHKFLSKYRVRSISIAAWSGWSLSIERGSGLGGRASRAPAARLRRVVAEGERAPVGPREH